MSQSTRIMARMIATFSIGGTSYVASCESAEVTFEGRLELADALQDTWEYPIGIRMRWNARGTFFINTANTAGHGGPGNTLATKALAFAQVAVSLADNAVSGGIGTWTGNALIERATQSFPSGGGPQTMQIELRGQGALAHAIT